MIIGVNEIKKVDFVDEKSGKTLKRYAFEFEDEGLKKDYGEFQHIAGEFVNKELFDHIIDQEKVV